MTFTIWDLVNAFLLGAVTGALIGLYYLRKALREIQNE